MKKWYFVSKIVLSYFEKKIVNNFWSSRLKAESLQKFWDQLSNLFEQRNVSTIFETAYFFKLFQEVSQI